MTNKFRELFDHNKIMFAALGLLMSWCIWVTTSVFSLDRRQSVSDQDIKNISLDISEIKQIAEDTRKQVVENKEEILKLLLSINREVKSRSLTK